MKSRVTRWLNGLMMQLMVCVQVGSVAYGQTAVKVGDLPKLVTNDTGVYIVVTKDVGGTKTTYIYKGSNFLFKKDSTYYVTSAAFTTGQGLKVNVADSGVKYVTPAGAAVLAGAKLVPTDTTVLIPGIKQFKDSVASRLRYYDTIGVVPGIKQFKDSLTAARNRISLNDLKLANTITMLAGFGVKMNGVTNGGQSILLQNAPSFSYDIDSNTISTKYHADSIAIKSVKYADTNTFIRTVASANTANALNVKYADTNTVIRTVFAANTTNATMVKYADSVGGSGSVARYVTAAGQNTFGTKYHLHGGESLGTADTIGTKDANSFITTTSGAVRDSITSAGVDYKKATGEVSLVVKNSVGAQGVVMGVGTGSIIGNGTPYLAFSTTATISSTTQYVTNNAVIGGTSYTFRADNNTPLLLSGPVTPTSGANFRLSAPRGTSGVTAYGPTTSLSCILSVGSCAAVGGVFTPASGNASMYSIVDSQAQNNSGTATGITGMITDLGRVFTGTPPDFRSVRLVQNVGRALSQEASGAISVHQGRFIFGSTTDNGVDAVQVTGNVNLTTAGNKIKVATGSNASIGTATLVGGTVTVSTTAVATGSKIFVSRNTVGGTTGDLSTPDASIVNGTSFVINSTSGSETSTVNWWIIN